VPLVMITDRCQAVRTVPGPACYDLAGMAGGLGTLGAVGRRA